MENNSPESAFLSGPSQEIVMLDMPRERSTNSSTHGQNAQVSLAPPKTPQHVLLSTFAYCLDQLTFTPTEVLLVLLFYLDCDLVQRVK